MDRQIFLKWLKINSLCLISAFIVTFALVQLFPDSMLGLWGEWRSLIEDTGAKGATQFTPDFNMFVKILYRNSISVFVVLGSALLLAAPILMIMYGVFFSLVASLARMTIGKAFIFSDWILISTEAAYLIISATFASTLATEIFGVKPEIKLWLRYWKKQFTDWKDPLAFPEQKRNWRIVFEENRKEFISFIILIIALLLFGAWLEVWGN